MQTSTIIRLSRTNKYCIDCKEQETSKTKNPNMAIQKTAIQSSLGLQNKGKTDEIFASNDRPFIQ